MLFLLFIINIYLIARGYVINDSGRVGNDAER